MEVREIIRFSVKRAGSGRAISVFNFLLLLTAFAGCIKQPEVTNPAGSKLPFDVQLVSATPAAAGNKVEVNPMDDITLNFRFTSDAPVFEIDMKTKDWRYGEKSLYGFPEHSNPDGSFSLNQQVIKTSMYDFVVAVRLHIPSYSRDSIVFTVRAVRKTDFAAKDIRVVLLIKNPKQLSFNNVYFGQMPYTGPGFTVLAQSNVYLQAGMHSSKKIEKAKFIAFLNGSAIASKYATVSDDYNIDSYSSLNCDNSGYGCNSYIFYIRETDNFLTTSSAMVGQDFKIRMVAFVEGGDSLSQDLPLSVVFPELNALPPANLGAPKNRYLGHFFHHKGALISDDISESYTSATFGYFQLGGENRLGSATYIYPKATELGYVIPSNSYRSPTYFRKVEGLYDMIDARYLDTVQINSTYPEQVSIQPNDVIIFSMPGTNSSPVTFTRGAIRINSIVASDSGSVNFSCKYQKL